MLTLCDICEYIKSQTDVGERIVSGALPVKTEKSIAVFDDNRSAGFRLALGGAENTRYRKQKITILIHWGRTSDGAMEKAYEIYRLFSGITDVRMNGVDIAFFTAREPQRIGFTEDKIYEYAVSADIYINKEE